MKKISWGVGITIFIIVFLILNAIFVFFAFGEKVDLVTDNYYAKELIYQEEIDKQKNYASLDESIEFIKKDATIIVKFPQSIDLNSLSGEIHFYRPSDSKYDKVFPLELNSEYEFVISTESLTKGYWKVKIDWEIKGSKFFKEEKVFIN
ncbi:MAG TPA: FixH family protein [Ignavibacteriaceae bacterium]|nr:FixH family protein [Ignavibacteriaceae bacterium]